MLDRAMRVVAGASSRSCRKRAWTAALATLLAAIWISVGLITSPPGAPRRLQARANGAQTAAGPGRAADPVPGAAKVEPLPPAKPSIERGAESAHAPWPPAIADPTEGVSVSVFEIESSLIAALAGLEESAAAQARIVPSLEKGAPNGFEILGARPGSFYAQMGLQHDDLVRRLNGEQLGTAEIALELLQRLRDSGRATLELERDGRLVRNEYVLVDDGGVDGR